MTEKDIWHVIHKMVKEKFVELEKAIKLVDHERRTAKGEKLPSPLKMVQTFIRRAFIGDKTYKSLSNRMEWERYLSAEDLLRLYSYLNFVLRRFYEHVIVDITYLIDETTKKVLGYTLKEHKGYEYVSPRQKFNNFYRAISNGRELNKDKDVLWIYEKRGLNDLPGAPRGSTSTNLNKNDQSTREEVVAELIWSCIEQLEERYGRIVTFEDAVLGKYENDQLITSGVRLGTRLKGSRLGIRKENLLDPPSLIRKLIGFDNEYRPVYTDDEGNLYDSSYEPLPLDTFFTTNPGGVGADD